ncbi:MAG: SHOCT domain-containing protein [Rhizobiales bacterium]|nr:SHOCT domain-containing protein [Hyphomicrobiales bacterium]
MGPAPAQQFSFQGIREAVLNESKSFDYQAAKQRLLSDWRAPLALIALVGLLFLHSFPPQFAAFIGSSSFSLFGVVSLVGDLLAASNVLGGFFGQVPAGARWAFRIVYLLYLVPISALVLFILSCHGKACCDGGLLARGSFLTAPILVPFLMALTLVQSIPNSPRPTQSFPVGPAVQNPSFFQSLSEILSFIGLGYWLILVAGGLQVWNHLNAFKKSPLELIGNARSKQVTKRGRRSSSSSAAVSVDSDDGEKRGKPRNISKSDIVNRQSVSVHHERKPDQNTSEIQRAKSIKALERLAELHKSGVLNDDEFAEEKRKILKQITQAE